MANANPVNVGERIRARRESLGLGAALVAASAGLSADEYDDVEMHDDELVQVVQLRHARKLCDALQLDLLVLAGVVCGHTGAPVSGATARNELVRAQRAALGLSQAQLGDLIGFETSAIAAMEDDPDYLDGWSIELVVELSGHLRLPPQALLGVKCRTCGR